MEQILFSYISQAGGFVVLAAFAVTIWRMISKSNSANSAESAIYDLMSKEITRLSKALEVSDNQVLELRKQFKEEREKNESEQRRLWMTIRNLEDKLAQKG